MRDRPTSRTLDFESKDESATLSHSTMKSSSTTQNYRESINEKDAVLGTEQFAKATENWNRTPIIEAVVSFANKRHTSKQVSLYNCINAINMAVKHNRIFAVCYINDSLLSALQFLKQQGIIFDYFVLPESYYNVLSLCKLSPVFANKLCVIYLRYSNEHGTALRHIKLLSKPSQQQYVTYTQLCKLVKHNSIAETYILHTAQGIVTASTALKEKIGGKLIALIT